MRAFCARAWQAVQGLSTGGGVAARVARGAFWSALGGMAASVLTLLTGIVLARLMGPGDFGQLGLVANTIGMFAALAGFGLGMGTAKHVAALRQEAPAEMWAVVRLSSRVVLATSGFTALALWFSAEGLAARYMGSGALATAVRIGLIMLCLNAWSGVQVGALSGCERFREVAVVRVVQAAGGLLFGGMGAWWHGVNGALFGAAAAALVACLVAAAIINRDRQSLEENPELSLATRQES